MKTVILPKRSEVRLDVCVSEETGVSRSASAKLISDGNVIVNGIIKPKSYIVSENDTVNVTIPDAKEIEAIPQNIELNIVYEDSDIIVVNKPNGMVVHPANGNPNGTLVNALLYHCKGSLSGINGELRPGIVHRIDKDTSGLLVVAKSDEVHRILASQLEKHLITREYHALVNGGFSADAGCVDLPIGRSTRDRKKMAVSDKGKRAVTHYEVIERFGPISYIKLNLETGRTHQIRVHMSHIGHPLLGDITYGGGNTRFEKEHADLLNGQCLHARKLSFKHPKTGDYMEFECPLPDEFTKLIKILKDLYKK